MRHLETLRMILTVAIGQHIDIDCSWSPALQPDTFHTKLYPKAALQQRLRA
ncbi:hypothetical protein D3C80_2242280 [compost metagenome]